MAAVARHGGSFRQSIPLRIAVAAVCLTTLLTMDAWAHVRSPDFGRLDRKPEVAKPEIALPETPLPENDAPGRIERRSATEQVPTKAGQGCAFSSGATRSSADAVLAAIGLGVPPPPAISEVDLHSVALTEAATAAAYQEMLALLEASPAVPEIVQVAQGATPDGAPCPLAVTLGSEGAELQTFWRFAPDDEPVGWFDEDGRRLGDAALGQPRPGSRISSPFGPRRYYGRLSGGGFHDGIDFESRIGQPILAAADGTIEHQGTLFEYGLTIKIRHAAQFTTLYAHMARFAAGSAVGSRVRKGDVIGYVGMTGRSTGAHLHFSAIINGKFSNPAPYLSDDGNRALNARTLAGFRKWQDDIRNALQDVRGRERRNPPPDAGWTIRL